MSFAGVNAMELFSRKICKIPPTTMVATHYLNFEISTFLEKKSSTMAKNQQKKNVKAKKQPAASKHAPGKRSTFNEDRKRAQAEAGGKVKGTNKTKAELGAKIYACLVEDCECTFEAWGAATRHMRTACTMGELPEDKPSIDLSRVKGNALLDEGKAKTKTYPKPTEEEMVEAIEEFRKENEKYDQFKHVMFKVVRKTWGLGEFTSFGFGTFSEFCEKHDFPQRVK
jgi:hypothetical protein